MFPPSPEKQSALLFPLPQSNPSGPLSGGEESFSCVVEEMRMGRRGPRVLVGRSYLGQGAVTAQPELWWAPQLAVCSPFHAHMSS